MTIDLSRLRRRPPRLRFHGALILVTCAAAAFAIVFRESVRLVFRHLYGASDVLDAFRSLPIGARIAVPVVGGFAAGGLSVLVARRRAGAGVGEVMEAVVIGERKMSLAATSWKAAGSWCAIVSGASIGREGPLIQFGGAAGSFFGRTFKVSEPRQRALIGAGTAAGFAAAYNTPFAAVLFVTEVVSGVNALGFVLPAMFAAAIASALTRVAVGAGPLYGAQPFELASQGELVLMFVTGVLAGAVGVAFVRILRLAETTFRALPVARPVRAGLGGAIVGIIACGLPEVTGNGYEPIREMLTSDVSIAFVTVFLIAKIVGTSASVGSGSPGGVFTPSLALGAALGVLVAQTFSQLIPSAHLGASGGYALVGMASVVAATTHAPLMAAVLVFELSGDYAIVLPLLIASVAATAVARWLEPRSIYMQELSTNGLAWEVTIDGRVIVRDDGESTRWPNSDA